jgi:hypothetical protein
MPEVVYRTGSPGRGSSELPLISRCPRVRKNSRNVEIMVLVSMAKAPFGVRAPENDTAGAAVGTRESQRDAGEPFPVAG